jgi:hypothetical protein
MEYKVKSLYMPSHKEIFLFKFVSTNYLFSLNFYDTPKNQYSFLPLHYLSFSLEMHSNYRFQYCEAYFQSLSLSFIGNISKRTNEKYFQCHKESHHESDILEKRLFEFRTFPCLNKKYLFFK